MIRGFDFKDAIEKKFREIGFGWDIKGVIDSAKRIYTITSDTKLISKVFELISLPIVSEVASQNGLSCVESDRQTVYPDITLYFADAMKERLAVDVKSTYRKSKGSAGFTLGSYTGYLRNPTKNIMFPYDEYKEHWIIGFIYTREEDCGANIVGIDEINSIIPTIKDVEIIVQEKWRIASDRPGSGNTANIGSITDIEGLKTGEGTFVKYDVGEAIFLDFWRNFVTKRDAAVAGVAQPYGNIEEYFLWRKQNPTESVTLPDQILEQLTLAGEANDVPREEP